MAQITGFWTRHPRYTIAGGLLSVILFLFLTTSPPHPSFSSLGANNWKSGPDSDLPRRLALSNSIYNEFLQDREGLIKKFGPAKEDVVLFSPDVAPWPAYTVWDFFLPAFNCPHEVQRIGALGDGGKWVCGLSRVKTKPDCVVYSFGINYESSFEAGILKRTDHCQVWGYDFSVDKFGPEIDASLHSRSHFFQAGLAGENRKNEDGLSWLYTLDTLMKENGHTHIDILKIDIEIFEFESLTQIIKTYQNAGKPLPFGQLQLEIHLWKRSFAEFLTWWEQLEEAGLRPFWTEPNLVYDNYHRDRHADLAEFSFLNIKGDNAFTTST